MLYYSSDLHRKLVIGEKCKFITQFLNNKDKSTISDPLLEVVDSDGKLILKHQDLKEALELGLLTKDEHEIKKNELLNLV